ncbi:hypothetical protein BH11GEM1_BH11GEM1_20460 [soil metagenome]
MSDDLFRHVQQLLGSEFEIDLELGRGGMGVVYSAVHRALGRRVAIKVLPPHLALKAGARERFVREARLAAALSHPGIVPVYTAAATGDIAYFAMALVEGESLADRIARDGRFSIDDARFVLAEVAAALGYAHDAGVVHRDIKPANILIDRATGRPVITDFGIARTLDDEHRITLDGDAIGTPSYMSPEQAMGDPDVDPRADLYSLGVVGYELVTGSLPFSAANAPALLTKHVVERPVPVLDRRPDVPPHIAGAIERALEKRPDARWHSMAEFRVALGAAPLPPRLSSRTLAPLAGGDRRTLTSALRQGVWAFRRKLFTSVVLAALLALLNVASAGLDRGIYYYYFFYDPDYSVLKTIGALLLMNLIFRGSRLYADNVSIREMFLGVPADEFGGATTAVHRHGARYERARRMALRDHGDISRLLGTMSPSEREMVGDVALVADALNQRIDKLAVELRDLDLELDVEKDLTGSMCHELVLFLVERVHVLHHELVLLLRRVRAHLHTRPH